MQFVKSNKVRGPDPVRVEYAAVTRANRDLAWKLFSDFRRWRRFSDFYGEIRWVSGAPWSVGSRLRIDLVRPVRTTVDHVIIACTPGDRVGWIDHSLHNTMEQWVVFEPRPEGGTLVHTWAEIVGPAVTVGGRAVRKLLKSFIELWYSRFCRECDHLWAKEQTADSLRDATVPGSINALC
jgi:hypothetical protein